VTPRPQVEPTWEVVARDQVGEEVGEEVGAEEIEGAM